MPCSQGCFLKYDLESLHTRDFVWMAVHFSGWTDVGLWKELGVWELHLHFCFTEPMRDHLLLGWSCTVAQLFHLREMDSMKSSDMGRFCDSTALLLKMRQQRTSYKTSHKDHLFLNASAIDSSPYKLIQTCWFRSSPHFLLKDPKALQLYVLIITFWLDLSSGSSLKYHERGLCPEVAVLQQSKICRIVCTVLIGKAFSLCALV